MQIQRINSYFNSRNQTNAVGNPQQNYMSKINSNRMNSAKMTDSVSFGISLEPKLLSAEVNELFRTALKKFNSEQKIILENLNKPIQELLSRKNIANLPIKEFVAKDVEGMVLSKTLDDGSIVQFSSKFLTNSNTDSILVKVINGDKVTSIKIQENCIEELVSNKNEVILNNAYTNSETTLVQLLGLRTKVNKEKVVDPQTSNGIKDISDDLKAALSALLDE